MSILKLFKLSLRLFPGLFALMAGYIKFANNQFTGTSFRVEDIEIVNSPEMVFLFYGNSGIYIYSVAILQLIGGLLLIFKKTSLIGALLCLIIFTNAMLVTYSFNFAPALVMFFLILNTSYLITLLFEYKRLKNIFIIHENTSS
jgi:uncharacterized membrane protein YphA (DoxX/SURF4 family)